MAKGKKKTKINKAKVFAVPSDETADGLYHEVSWAKDGNLNASTRRGDVRRFRMWGKAKSFAIKKGKELGVKALIHHY